ncbi:MAG TPA: hypothetical protein VE967_17395, partial [Gemmatimonadaceae bacterium]|nr:hypothetical protein [Gemmatimonadaceae bacterium]
MTNKAARVSFALALSVSAVSAQQQATIPIRKVAIEATSTESFRTPQVSAWQWPDGSIIATARERSGKVLVFDKDMKVVRVLVDSSLTAGSMIAFANFLAMPFRGDTTVVVDPGNAGLLVVDRNGKQVRIMALPRGNDMRNISTGQFGNFVDPHGRLVYRTAYGKAPGASAAQGKI